MYTQISIFRIVTKFLILIIAIAFMVINSSQAAEPLTVFVVNYPIQYFTERIGGEHVNVVFPAPANVDPAYWMPDRPTIADFQRADLILLDLGMTAQDGAPLLHRIRQRDARVPLIAMTSDARGEEAAAAKRLGVETFLEKPFEMERLHAAVGDALRSPHVA